MKKLITALVLLLLLPVFSFAQARKKLSITVDERVELITTMQLLFGYPLVGKSNIRYKQEALDYFSKYENDTSVAYFLNIAQKGFGFSLPFTYIYHFSFPQLRQTGLFTDYENKTLELAAHPEWQKPFLHAVDRFYKKTKFHNFYTSHKPFYDSIISTVRKTVDSAALIDKLESHYGVKQHSYNLVLSLLSISNGFSIWVKTKKGNDLYSIIGPEVDSKIVPYYDTRWLMQYLVLHEFSHPFCNPLIDKYWDRLEKDSCLFVPIKKYLNQQGCGDWKSALCEFLTRSNEIVLIEDIFGKADADRVYNEYLKNQKWLYIEGLVPIMKDYRNNRDKYKTLDDIMPKLIAYFDSEAQKCNH